MSFDQSAYNRDYYQKHSESLKKKVFDDYHRKKNDPDFKARKKAEREKAHFGVPATVIFRKTQGLCYFCGNTAEVIHHLDEDGRNYEQTGVTPGHDTERLVPACRACHMDIHRDKLMMNKKTRANGYWSRKYTACIECGTSDRKHCGHGLCVNCAARARRKGGGA